MPSDIIGTILQESSDAKSVVVQLRKRLQLDHSSLKEPNPETRGWIRALAGEAKLSDRLDVVKHLREIVPAGTTGKYAFDIEDE